MLRSEATASLLASNATNYTWPPKYGYPRNQRNVGMTLLFAILTKYASLTSYESYVYSEIESLKSEEGKQMCRNFWTKHF